MTPQLIGCRLAAACVQQGTTVQAAVLMDLHAHLSCAEVIGLLGGTWDLDQRQIKVGSCPPIKVLLTEAVRVLCAASLQRVSGLLGLLSSMQ